MHIWHFLNDANAKYIKIHKDIWILESGRLFLLPSLISLSLFSLPLSLSHTHTHADAPIIPSLVVNFITGMASDIQGKVFPFLIAFFLNIRLLYKQPLSSRTVAILKTSIPHHYPFHIATPPSERNLSKPNEDQIM